MLDMAENYPAMMRALWETGRNTMLDYAVRNPAITRLVERKCVRGVDHILVVVEESADRIETLGVSHCKLSVVSNTPPLSRLTVFPRKVPAARDRLEVVYIGNVEVVRGLLESVDAIAQLGAEGMRIRLRIIGDGRDIVLIRQRCESHHMRKEDVEFLGRVDHDEALRLVAEADIGLVPHRKSESWDTTIPNKLFDYMAVGLPVVSSDAVPCARVVVETDSGRVFSSGDARSMATTIRQVASPSARLQMGAAGRAAIAARYNWEHDTAVLLDAVTRTKNAR
jgi:glycosyltransferase involved in cell wall biosynthesis